MAKSIRASTKKRGRPVTTGKGEPVVVRMQPAQLAVLDTWIAAQGRPMSRPQGIRLLIRTFLGDGAPPEGVVYSYKDGSVTIELLPVRKRALDSRKKKG